MELIARYLLDTNAIIYLVNGRLASPLPEGKYSISIITEIELLSFGGLSGQEEQRIRDLLLVLDRVPLTDTVRDQAILLRSKNQLKLPAAISAASGTDRAGCRAEGDRVAGCTAGSATGAGAAECYGAWRADERGDGLRGLGNGDGSGDRRCCGIAAVA